MNRYVRRTILVGVDVAVTILAVLVAFWIRFDGTFPTQFLSSWLRALPVVIPGRILVYYAFGLYRQMWSHASIPELLRLVWAVTLDTLLTAGFIYLVLMPEIGFPRSVLMIAWFLKIGLLGAVRLALRLRHEWIKTQKNNRQPGQKTLIYGAGDAGTMLAREMAKHPELGCMVAGFVDDNVDKQGYQAAGKRILGTRAQLPEIVKKYGITNLVIAMPSAKGAVIREIVAAGRSLGLQLKTVPGLFELVNGTVTASQIRDVQIEDLLGREEIKVDLEAIAAYLAGEVVLVTGAGGSIGSELCRQVARFGPRQMILLGHGENSIYDIHQELQASHPSLDLRPVIADVQDEARIQQLFAAIKPGVVFHAAAHKHVPLMEANPEEAIKNNVFGTLHVARAADRHRVKRFVLLSTDKAVNPTSVMGATKRTAEYIVQSFARTSRTAFVTVRFGNVLGSRGSVIPLFKKQIEARGPVTVTDPRMVRYFMTIPEAVQLVIQAASMGGGGELFVLDMGEPVRIVELARDLIRLSGFEPDVEIPIIYTGARSGEKLYEELLTAAEGTMATQHQRIFVARGDKISEAVMAGFMESLKQAAVTGDLTNDWLRAEVGRVASKEWASRTEEVGD